MFEKYVIVADSLRNASKRGLDGFEFDVRVAYYRGIPVSMLDGFEVTVDGTVCDPSSMIFAVGDYDLTFEEIETEVEARWEFNQTATLFVPWPDGLAAGEHLLEVVEIIRVAYMPEPVRRADTKTLTVA